MASANILVVDDEPDIRRLVQEILQDEGYAVGVAENAEAARQARRARKLDLALLDIWMPDTDGITLLGEWAEDFRRCASATWRRKSSICMNRQVSSSRSRQIGWTENRRCSPIEEEFANCSTTWSKIPRRRLARKACSFPWPPIWSGVRGAHGYA